MMHHGMCELTGADHAGDAWKRFFSPGDRVGIKVNPVGRTRGGTIGSISSFDVVREVVLRLRTVPASRPEDIVVFERYAEEFIDAGYEKSVAGQSARRPLGGVVLGYDNADGRDGFDSRPRRRPLSQAARHRLRP